MADLEIQSISGEVTWFKSKCRCYAQFLPPVVQFSMHFGAHNEACPVYRVSRDPVDAQYDIEFREAHENSVVDCVHCAQAHNEVTGKDWGG